ncbi:cyanocobalamin reductase / alkylcobalamin dealkylase [Hydra vulgaris]|uniref:cyanocobalamin reductase / alkylcobalamin dealkylase n=1 Tax=Hydra vulgaris TaxID=6087 RepID=UPI0001926CAC|nr:cyanocobalamin reductase / alkylcobalamin dealkylase [Hydra vulgaris]
MHDELTKFTKIVETLKEHEKHTGLEYYPFNIGNYNEQVSTFFQLNYPKDTVAFCVLSSPSWFETIFLPYIKHNKFLSGNQDPLDQCISSLFIELKDQFAQDSYEIDVIHDFDMGPTRKPKVLVQTAGHVSGAAYYYQKKDVDYPDWKDKKLYGVSIHPVYGGWFSFRGVLIFRNFQMQLEKKIPEDNLNHEQKVNLLELYNYKWKDFQYRNVNSPKEKYSEKQQEYFITKPSDRWTLINSWNNSNIS